MRLGQWAGQLCTGSDVRRAHVHMPTGLDAGPRDPTNKTHTPTNNPQQGPAIGLRYRQYGLQYGTNTPSCCRAAAGRRPRQGW